MICQMSWKGQSRYKSLLFIFSSVNLEILGNNLYIGKGNFKLR